MSRQKKGELEKSFLCLIAHSTKGSESILSFLHKINCQEVVKEGGKGKEGKESIYLSSGKLDGSNKVIKWGEKGPG